MVASATILLIDAEASRQAQRLELLQRAGIQARSAANLTDADNPDVLILVGASADPPVVRQAQATDAALIRIGPARPSGDVGCPTVPLLRADDEAHRLLSAIRETLRQRRSGEASLYLQAGLIDLRNHQIIRSEGSGSLTPLEVDLLEYLALAQGSVIPREELLERVWGYRRGVETRAVDQVVSRLRAKIEADPSRPAHLLTVRGVGYRLQLSRPKARSLTGNILGYPDQFVGRKRQLQDLTERLSAQPGLWTLLGVGGMGKSRLANEVGMFLHHQGTLEGGIWWCELAACHQRSAILQAICGGIGIRGPLEPGDDPSLLADILASRGATLLVLDNCEHQIEDIHWLVSALLPRCRQLRILATSRVRLRCRGEQVVVLPPLSPLESQVLFQARADDFPHDTDVFSEILQRLEGHPLSRSFFSGFSSHIQILVAGVVLLKMKSESKRPVIGEGLKSQQYRPSNLLLPRTFHDRPLPMAGTR